MPSIDILRTAARAYANQNLRWANAYSSTHSWMTPLNVLLVAGAAIASGAAAVTNLFGVLSLPKETSGILAAVGGVLGLLHGSLGCATYRSECKRLLGVHWALANEYNDLLAVDNTDEFAKRLKALNVEFKRETNGIRALPLRWYKPEIQFDIRDE